MRESSARSLLKKPSKENPALPAEKFSPKVITMIPCLEAASTLEF